MATKILIETYLKYGFWRARNPGFNLGFVRVYGMMNIFFYKHRKLR
jgi:hypothetical protein